MQEAARPVPGNGKHVSRGRHREMGGSEQTGALDCLAWGQAWVGPSAAG